MIERYQDLHQAEIWSNEAKLNTWAAIERGVSDIAGRYTVEVPPQIGELLCEHPYRIDMERLAEIERTTHHDFVAFLTHWREQLDATEFGQQASRWLHWGLTSSDVIDTALAITVNGATYFLVRDLEHLASVLREQAITHASTLRLGRTHGRGAEATYLGLRFAMWEQAARRIVARIESASEDAARVKLSGPVGTYSHLPPSVEDQLARNWALQPAGPSSQVYMRDSLAHWAHAVGQAVELCEAIATEFRLAAQTGIDEVAWPDEAGSSVMPHKSNPATAENICGLARLARANVQALSPFALWGDRDLSHSSVERVALADLCHLAATATNRTRAMVKNARWDCDRMQRNLSATGDDPFRAGWALDWIVRGHGVDEARKLAMEGESTERTGRNHRRLLRNVANVIIQSGAKP